MSSQFVWGWDPAVAHQSVGFASMDWEEIEVESFFTQSENREGQRLWEIDKYVRSYARQAAKRFPPAVVWIEQPSGRFLKPQSYYVVGVIQVALFAVLAVPVWTVPPKAWKSRSVGNGNATKSQVRSWVDAKRWDVDSQDEADASCIAYAGREMFRTSRWETAA